MGNGHLALLGGAEVVAPGAEGVPHHAVALGAPIERCGRCHAAVHPVVGVDDGDALALVREAAVLPTAAVEVFVGSCGEGQRRALLAQLCGEEFLHHDLTRAAVGQGEQARTLVDAEGHLVRRGGDGLCTVLQDNAAGVAAGVINENLCGGRGHGVAQDAALIVAEQAHDVGAVEVEGEHLAVLVEHLDGGGVDLARTLHHAGVGHAADMLSGQRRCGGQGRGGACGERQSQRHDGVAAALHQRRLFHGYCG